MTPNAQLYVSRVLIQELLNFPPGVTITGMHAAGDCDRIIIEFHHHALPTPQRGELPLALASVTEHARRVETVIAVGDFKLRGERVG